MGARVNFIFKDSNTGPWVAFYSHWGEDNWRRDLAIALEHARPNWNESSYFTRMVISKLIEGDLLGRYNYGIWALTPDTLNEAYMDVPIIIDMVNQEVEGHSYESFIDYQAELLEYHQ